MNNSTTQKTLINTSDNVDTGKVLIVLDSLKRGLPSWDVIGYNGITEADYHKAYTKLKKQGVSL